MITLEYLDEQEKKVYWAMTNPSATPGVLRYLKAHLVAIQDKRKKLTTA